MPAKAGIHLSARYVVLGWIPAFAGMTNPSSYVFLGASAVKFLGF